MEMLRNPAPFHYIMNVTEAKREEKYDEFYECLRQQVMASAPGPMWQEILRESGAA